MKLRLIFTFTLLFSSTSIFSKDYSKIADSLVGKYTNFQTIKAEGTYKNKDKFCANFKIVKYKGTNNHFNVCAEFQNHNICADFYTKEYENDGFTSDIENNDGQLLFFYRRTSKDKFNLVNGGQDQNVNLEVDDQGLKKVSIEYDRWDKVMGFNISRYNDLIVCDRK